MENEELLRISDLDVSFKIGENFYKAVSKVNLKVHRNEILAIVGESGCGKSTLATAVMGLHDKNNTSITGHIFLKDNDLLNFTEEQYNQVRGKTIGMIFQDPLSALNPLKKIKDQIIEVMDYHTKMNKEQKEQKMLQLLNQVGIKEPQRVANIFPHELSGGMRQRVIIAIAIACKPDLLIADEPTTALDVTIQAQILDLLTEIQHETHSGIVLITHDLGVVAQTADTVAVMYAGQIVEKGTVYQIFENPLHPYTRSLLRSMPQNNHENDNLYVISGNVPSLQRLPTTGDFFAPRIPWIPATAHEKKPTMHQLENGHEVRCTCYRDFYFPED